jgi:hypothetical protein
MSQLIDASQGLELRDPAGAVIGTFVPRKVLQELIAERDHLRKVVATVQAERDAYLHALYALSRKEMPLTSEERIDLEKNSVPAEQVMQEIERICRHWIC